VSYRLDLDEISTKRLREELKHRHKLRREGKCDYCGRDPSTPSCKFPERHILKKTKEPLLLRFLKFLRDGDRKVGVLSEHELTAIIKDFWRSGRAR
jgi:hypothetical protein